MKAAAFEYHDPASLADAVALLAAHPDARPLAGGQSLVPMLNMRYVIADHVVDLNGIAELDFIRRDGDALVIGAMTRQRTLMDSDLVRSACPILADALTWVGHFQTRNRGTIGGSLCHLDPAAELPTVMAAHDAVLVAAGQAGRREIAMADWALGYMTPALEPGEILTEIGMPLWPDGHGHAFVEFARRHGDFAIVCVAALVELEGSAIRRAAIAVSGVDTRPLRLGAAEKALAGRPPGPEAFAAAAEIARRIEAMSDAYATAAYRQRLAAVLVERALAKACARSAGGT
jgi:aerobic carbon-monoxide dehydrogenase medium subunit